jgi:CheY-like chemotaxis protein
MASAMIVDDVGDIRALMSLLLKSCGLEVLEAGSGADAVRLVSESGCPDLVVMDLQMPDMDGWSALSAMREVCTSDRMAVVVCSVKAEDERGNGHVREPVDSYIQKPFANAAFIETITSLVALTPRQRRALRERRN